MAQWGLRALVHPSENTYVRLGGYLSDPTLGDSSNHGLDFSFNPSAGVLAMAEVGFTPELKIGGHKLRGHYKLGVYHDSAEFALLADPDVTRSGQYGAYIVVQQEAYREPDSSETVEIHALFGRHLIRHHRPAPLQAGRQLTKRCSTDQIHNRTARYRQS